MMPAGFHKSLVCSLLLWSCTAAPRINFTPVSVAQRSAKSPESCRIEVFRDEIPSRKYSEIGTINYHHEWHRLERGVTQEQAITSIQKRACEVGAEAIMNVQVREEKRLEFAFINVRATAIEFIP
jgi:hypothetical protein